jgi:DEAD/DEAH box helicase domain-containing protein
VIDGLRGLGAALETVSTLAMMCDPRDLGQTLGDGGLPGGEGALAAPGRDYQAGRSGGFDPTVFLFDAHPGGVGLAERLFERAPELLDQARLLIETCPCKNGGCPACVGPADEGARKRVSLQILNALELRHATPRPARVGT